MVNTSLPTDDSLLWQQLKAGDSGAVTALMKRHYSDLYNYGLKISSDRSITKDCIQDLFVKLWRDREKLNDVLFVKTYLLKSLKRRILKKIVDDQRLVNYTEALEDKVEITFSQEDILVSQQEQVDQKEMVVRNLNKLPARQREAIYLKFYEELTNEQIAEVMDLKPQSVYNLIHEALKFLKSHILKGLSVIAWLLFRIYV